MKKLFILLFYSVSLTIFGQSSVYKPFCNNPSWTTGFTNFGGTGYETYQYQLDSTIGTHVYKKIKNIASPFNYALFREDAALKRVYQYDITNSVDYLYIDFSLNVGNTFTVIANGGAYSATVTTKDSVLINGCYHNSLSLNTIQPPNFVGYRFVEGILSDVNPLNPFVWGGDPYVHVICECHNGQTYYYDNGGSFNNYTCYLTCTPATQCSVVNSIYELFDSKEKSIVFPNPSTNLIFIKNEIDLKDKKYVVFDYTIKEVLSDKYNSEKGIDIHGLKSGIYTISIHNSFMKFIKID